MGFGYDENGKVMIASKAEVDEAKLRVSLKRSIRRKTLGLIFVRNMATHDLINLDNAL